MPAICEWKKAAQEPSVGCQEKALEDIHLEHESQVVVQKTATGILLNGVLQRQWEEQAIHSKVRTWRLLDGETQKILGYLHKTLGSFEYIDSFKELQRIRAQESPKAFAVKEKGLGSRYYLSSKPTLQVSREVFTDALQQEATQTCWQRVTAFVMSAVLLGPSVFGGWNLLNRTAQQLPKVDISASKVGSLALMALCPPLGFMSQLPVVDSYWQVFEGPEITQNSVSTNCSRPTLSINGPNALVGWQHSTGASQIQSTYRIANATLHPITPEVASGGPGAYSQYNPISTALPSGFAFGYSNSTQVFQDPWCAGSCPIDVVVNEVNSSNGSVLNSRVLMSASLVDDIRLATGTGTNNVSYLGLLFRHYNPNEINLNLYNSTFGLNASTTLPSGYKGRLSLVGNQDNLLAATANQLGTVLVYNTLNRTISTPLFSLPNINAYANSPFLQGALVGSPPAISLVYIDNSMVYLNQQQVGTGSGPVMMDIGTSNGTSYLAFAWNGDLGQNNTQTVKYAVYDQFSNPQINETMLHNDGLANRSNAQVRFLPNGDMAFIYQKNQGIVATVVSLQGGNSQPTATSGPTSVPTPAPTPSSNSPTPASSSSLPPQPTSVVAASSSLGSLSIGGLVGIVITLISVCAVAVGIFALYVKRRSRASPEENNTLEKAQESSSPHVYDNVSKIIDPQEKTHAYDNIPKGNTAQAYENVSSVNSPQTKVHEYNNLPKGNAAQAYENVSSVNSPQTKVHEYNNLPKVNTAQLAARAYENVFPSGNGLKDIKDN